MIDSFFQGSVLLLNTICFCHLEDVIVGIRVSFCGALDHQKGI